MTPRKSSTGKPGYDYIEPSGKGQTPMNQKPKISIVTPTFNCGPFIRECIESVLSQNYQNVEHIIVDGASDDGTVEILKEYPHLRWISEPDRGEADALNKGLRMATGEIIGWLGGDDRYLGEHVLDWVAKKAEGLTGSYVLYGKGLFINEDGEAVRLHIPKIPITLAIVSRWFNGHGLFQPSMFYTKQLLGELGDFREDLPFGIDYEYWLRIAARGYAFHYCDHILGESREGGRAESKSVMAPFETRANEWTKIAAGYQVSLTESEQINFWKDYYSYRIQAQSQYSEPIQYPEQQNELLGFAAALDLCNHLPGLREAFERLVHRFPKCEESYWLLASCLVRNGEPREAEEIRAKMVMMLSTPQKHDCDTSLLGGLLDKNTPMRQVENRARNGTGVQPLVSVIIPTFNRPERLIEAVQSVLAQTYASIEILVINDGGCDVERLLTSLPGSESIQYLRIGQNRERSYARNMGLKLANGKYIAYLDDDDRYYPTHVETLASFLEHSDYLVAYSDAHRTLQVMEHGCYVKKAQDVPYSIDFNADLILRNNFIPMLSLMHAKSCIEHVGGFDETLSTHEDWDLVIRLSRCFSLHHIPSVTAEFTWRTDGTSTTSQRPEDFQRTGKIIHERYRTYKSQADMGQRPEGEVSDKQESHSKTYDCSIIIPVFNRADLTKQCLTQLAKVTDGVQYEVIIVDNHSSDGTSEFLESLSGDVQIIRNSTNLGFAKACNQGARAAQGRYLVFLNNDTIPKSGWLDPLIAEVNSCDEVAVVGSKLLYPDNTIQHAGVVISRNSLMPYHLFRGVPERMLAVNVRREFQAVTAACMLVRKLTFEEVGGFDEGFVNGYEDVDLCLKIRQLGKKVVYQPKSCLYHLESQTPDRKKYDEENFLRLIARWEHQWLVDEDLIAYQNGYVIRRENSEEKLQAQLLPKDDMVHPDSWQRVVFLQSQLLGRECQPLAEMKDNQKIRELLVDVEGWPNDIGILEWVGSVCESLHCEQEAIQFWEKLLTIGDHPTARLGLARTQLKNGNLGETQRHLDELKRGFTPKAEGWTLQGILSMQKQEFGEAKQAFEESLNIDCESKKARLGFGMACMGLGETDEAWHLFEHVKSMDPDNIEAMRCLLQVGTVLQRWDALSDHLTQFVERNPTNCDMRFALAGVEYRARHFGKAREQLTWLRLMAPNFEGLEDLERQLNTVSSQENLLLTN
jgi:GT2 family glycosyltransferase